MKILTLNFLTCARKSCKTSQSSFPLHPRNATLETLETPLNTLFLQTLLPRLDWPALRAICAELGLPSLSDEVPDVGGLWEGGMTAPTADTTTTVDTTQETSGGDDGREPSRLARDLHRILVETCVKEGGLVCGECGHEYAVKEGIANFLLPAHLV